MKAEPKYPEIVEKIEIISKFIVFQLAEKVETNKDKFLRNSITKSISLLKSISQLYEKNEFNSGWVLYRSLLDRLIYIIYFSNENNFNAFDNWSYFKTFEYRNDIKSFNKYEVRKPKKGLEHTKSEIEKYYALKKSRLKWVKPNPEFVLKERGFGFLYSFGYDFASSHTHPLVTDGEFEFYSLTGLEPNPYKILDKENLIKNSILVHSFIQQEIYNQLTFRFRGILNAIIDETRKLINKENNEFDSVYQRIVIFIDQNISLFEK